MVLGRSDGEAATDAPPVVGAACEVVAHAADEDVVLAGGLDGLRVATRAVGHVDERDAGRAREQALGGGEERAGVTLVRGGGERQRRHRDCAERWR